MTLNAYWRGLLVLLLSALPAGASELSIPPGESAEAADNQGAEAFAIPHGVTAALVATPLGHTLRIDNFPAAAGYRTTVDLKRIDVYSPKARILIVDAAGERGLPRSRRLYFLGSAADDPITRVALSAHPETGRLRGWVDGPLGEFVIRRDGDSGYRLESPAATLARDGIELQADCGSDQLPLPASLDDLWVRVPELVTAERGGAPTHSAVVAVDTDMELLNKKFDNSTSEATDWIADLFAAMNIAYERDVGLRLLQGETILRPGSPPYTGDPWNVNGAPASNAHLNEFGNYWASNMSSVDRVFAMLLSGKSSSGTSSSGIARIDGYCEFQNNGGGYSVTQVFTADVSVTNDVRVVGHEIGHNAGSPHTHCYSPPVDECYNAQNGCYNGAPSCPPAGSGTLMSYCHFGGSSGADCGANLIEFHPTVVALFNNFIASHTPSCIELIDTSEIFSDGFESGDTSAWSEG